MNVLITGATGFVGQAVTREACLQGHAVHALVRHPDAPAAARLRAEAGVALHMGDILDPPSLDRCLPTVEAVIHLVGIIAESRSVRFESVHREGTRNVVAAARKWGVRRFVHMSALGTRAGAASRYHRTKWEAEEAVRASGREHTIFRPSLIFGPGDGFVNTMARLIRKSPFLPVMGSGRSRVQPVDVGSVAQAFAGALEEPRSVGRTLDLCGPDTLTYLEAFQAIAAATGHRRRPVHIPLPVARLQARVLEWIYARLLNRPPPLSRDQLLMLQEDNVGDGGTAAELFGLRPLEFRTGIRSYLSPDGERSEAS